VVNHAKLQDPVYPLDRPGFQQQCWQSWGNRIDQANTLIGPPRFSLLPMSRPQIVQKLILMLRVDVETQRSPRKWEILQFVPAPAP
jgi:hypothetical protein